MHECGVFVDAGGQGGRGVDGRNGTRERLIDREVPPEALRRLDDLCVRTAGYGEREWLNSERYRFKKYTCIHLPQVLCVQRPSVCSTCKFFLVSNQGSIEDDDLIQKHHRRYPVVQVCLLHKLRFFVSPQSLERACG